MSSTHATTSQNDSHHVQDVPAAADDVDYDVKLFNLSTLSDNDLLPDELPYQVSVPAITFYN